MTTEQGQHGPYHRLGEPGGPSCRVAVLPITVKGPDGAPAAAQLWDAGTEATEVELLRKVAEAGSVQWGHDDLGWWAVVPVAQPPVAPQSPNPPMQRTGRNGILGFVRRIWAGR